MDEWMDSLILYTCLTAQVLVALASMGKKTQLKRDEMSGTGKDRGEHTDWNTWGRESEEESKLIRPWQTDQIRRGKQTN